MPESEKWDSTVRIGGAAGNESETGLAPVEPKSLIGIVGNNAHQRKNSLISFPTYDLAIVEFDDQGCCQERAQMRGLAKKISGLHDDANSAARPGSRSRAASRSRPLLRWRRSTRSRDNRRRRGEGALANRDKTRQRDVAIVRIADPAHPVPPAASAFSQLCSV